MFGLVLSKRLWLWEISITEEILAVMQWDSKKYVKRVKPQPGLSSFKGLGSFKWRKPKLKRFSAMWKHLPRKVSLQGQHPEVHTAVLPWGHPTAWASSRTWQYHPRGLGFAGMKSVRLKGSWKAAGDRVGGLESLQRGPKRPLYEAVTGKPQF